MKISEQFYGRYEQMLNANLPKPAANSSAPSESGFEQILQNAAVQNRQTAAQNRAQSRAQAAAQNAANAKAASILLDALRPEQDEKMKQQFFAALSPHENDYEALKAHHAGAFAAHQPAKHSRYSAQELAKLREQTDAFEAFFIKSILDISMPRAQNALFGKDAGDEIYRDMHHDAIARAMSGRMGLSEILYEYLSQS